MAVTLHTGLRATATISGTGSYSGLANVTNYRPFSAVTDGQVVPILVVATGGAAAGTFEALVATKSGGSSPVLARTAIRRQSDGTQNLVDWPSGTPVVIYSSLAAEDAAAVSAENVWTEHQHHGAKRITFHDKTTYLEHDGTSLLRLYLGGTDAVRWLKSGGAPVQDLYFNDSGAAAGPYYRLVRDSSSPAANDLLGDIQYIGKNSAAESIVYVQAYGVIGSPTDGAEQGWLQVDAFRAGTPVTAACIGGDGVSIFPTLNSGSAALLVGKALQGLASIGSEARSDGLIAGTTSNIPCLYLNRKGSDGDLAVFYRDEAAKGSISVSGETVSLNGATMAHPGLWADGTPPTPLIGAVVCSAEGLLDDGSRRHPLCVLSSLPDDDTVYGVVQGVMDWVLADGTVITALHVEAVGSGLVQVTGPVRRGELLMTSHLPGVACAQGHRNVTAGTLAKAVQSSPDDGTVRLVPCTLMAG